MPSSPAIARRCTSANDAPEAAASAMRAGSTNTPIGFEWKSGLVRIHCVDAAQSPKLSDLQLHAVAVGVLVVVGERHPVVDAEVRLDPRATEPQIAGVQVGEAAVLEGAVVHPGSCLALGVIDEPGEAQQRDAVVCAVVRQPCPCGVLEAHLRSHDGPIPVDQLLQPCGLEVDVMECGPERCLRAHPRAFLSLLSVCRRWPTQLHDRRPRGAMRSSSAAGSG